MIRAGGDAIGFEASEATWATQENREGAKPLLLRPRFHLQGSTANSGESTIAIARPMAALTHPHSPPAVLPMSELALAVARNRAFGADDAAIASCANYPSVALSYWLSGNPVDRALRAAPPY
jgi:hypothetical protein